MKKVGIVSLASLAFLSLASLCAYLLRFVKSDGEWVYIAIGICLLVISGILAVFAKKNIAFNSVCSGLSAVALGFLIRAWYLFRGFDNPLWMMLSVSLAAVVYLWAFYLLAHIPAFRRHAKLFSVLFVILSAVGYAVVVFTTKTTFVSTFGYYMILELAFIFAMCKSTSEPCELVRAITLSTYTLFAVAVLIAVLALLDGDFDFDLDFDLDFDGVELGAEVVEGAIDFPTGAEKNKKR